MIQQKPSIKEDILFLLLKIAIFLILLFVMFFWVFGITRCNDNSMDPAFKDGDLAFYYRLQKEYNNADVVVI